MPLKFLVSILLLARLFYPIETAGAQEFTFYFNTAPEGAQLNPSRAPATLTLTVKAPDGQVPAAGWIVVRLDAPPPGRFLSTDFPAVEGSRLLEMRLPVIHGKAEWRQILPIRGDYRLAAQFVDAAGAKAEQVFSFRVYENNQKWLFLGAFALGLFVTGVIAGRIFSGPRGRETAKLGVWPLLFLTYFVATGESAWAQDDQKRKYFSKIEVASPTVGAPARIHWWLHPAGIEGKPSARLTLRITHVEKNLLVFSAEKILVAGEFSLDYQFTDGSDHRITAIADIDDGETIRQEQLVSITAVAPPWRAQLPALALFLFLIFLGLWTGRWSRRASVGRKVS